MLQPVIRSLQNNQNTHSPVLQLHPRFLDDKLVSPARSIQPLWGIHPDLFVLIGRFVRTSCNIRTFPVCEI